jgi:diguanylate cyclase (GGDEF)-like protein
MALVSNEERNLNYDNFIDRLDIELQRAKRYGRVVSLLIISIDGADKSKEAFPKTFLREFTRMVLDQARTVDITVTISSEEFALILPETPFDNAKLAAERIRKAIEEHTFEDAENKRQITVSVGVAAYPEHSSETHELARRAMQSGANAKGKGGNAVCTASEL